LAEKVKLRYARLVAAVLLMYAAMLCVPGVLKFFYPLKHKEIIVRYGQLNNIDPPLIAALIKTESNFKPNAESRKGARGLMQITPKTGKWIADNTGMKDYDDSMLFHPEINIKLGSWYIKHLSDYYGGNFELVFAAYNGGSGNVDKWLKNNKYSLDGKTLDVIPFSETENFIKRLKKNYGIYKRIYIWEESEE